MTSCGRRACCMLRLVQDFRLTKTRTKEPKESDAPPWEDTDSLRARRRARPPNAARDRAAPSAVHEEHERARARAAKDYRRRLGVDDAREPRVGLDARRPA